VLVARRIGIACALLAGIVPCLAASPGVDQTLVGAILDASGVDSPEGRARYLDEVRRIAGEAAARLGDRKPTLRRARRLYRMLHEEHLLRYRDDADGLDAILDRGEFNCVSASLLLGIVARATGFEVAILEGPHHLLPVLRVGDRQVLVETTSPAGFDLLRAVRRARAVPFGWPVPPELVSHAVFGASAPALEPVDLATAVAYVWHNVGQRALARGDAVTAAEAFLREHRLHPGLTARSEALANALARAFRHEYDAGRFEAAQRIAEIDLSIYPGRTTGHDRLLAAALKRILAAADAGDAEDGVAILEALGRADLDPAALARLEREACPAIAAEAVRKGDWGLAARMADRYEGAERDPDEAARLRAWVADRRAGRADAPPRALRLAG
jgi:hypothetical protein